MKERAKQFNFKKGAAFLEDVVLAIVTFTLAEFYLFSHDQISVAWLFAGAILILIGFVGAVIMSYKATEASAATRFLITPQLIKTMKAKRVPRDVLEGLEALYKSGNDFVEGVDQFRGLLEQTLGRARSREVESVIFKYAQT